MFHRVTVIARVLILVLTMGVLAACQGQTTTEPLEPLPSPTGESSPAPADPTAEPAATATPEENGGGEPEGIPTFYYRSFDSGSSQLWRRDPDGSTRQITDEALGVREFDVSPVDGALAFLTGSQVVRTDAEGNDRRVLVDEATMTELMGDENLGPARGIFWAPNGEQLLVGVAGLYLIDAESGEPEALAFNDSQRVFNPAGWSPDGTMVLAAVGFRGSDGGTQMLVDVASGNLTDLGTFLCCGTLEWTADGGSIYYANPLSGLLDVGLWRINLTTAQVETLLGGEASQGGEPAQMRHYAEPALGPDGFLYLFTGLPGEIDPNTGQPMLALAMGRLPLDDIREETVEMVREETLSLGQALWSEGATGALVWSHPQPWNEQGGDLTWLPADPSQPALPLGVTGREMQWAPTP